MRVSSPASFPRRGILALGLVGLAGCATKPIVIDRAAMAGVRRIAVPTVGFPSSPDVQVRDSVASRFGLIGLATESIMRGNRSDAVKAILAARGFDPRAHLQTALTERLAARGLTVLPEPADAARGDFLQTYATGGRDAVLDTWVSQYGFVALSDASDAPFRPNVTLNTRLVQARDKSVLMQDTVLIDGVVEPVPARDSPPLGASTFRNFAEIEANPDRAVAGLRAALASAADGVVRRLA